MVDGQPVGAVGKMYLCFLTKKDTTSNYEDKAWRTCLDARGFTQYPVGVPGARLATDGHVAVQGDAGVARDAGKVEHGHVRDVDGGGAASVC